MAMQDDSRLLDNLRYVCGPVITTALEAPDVVEIILNPDANLWIERYGREPKNEGVIEREQAKSIMYLVASGLGIEVNAHNPVIEGIFPLDGTSRFEGVFPPLSTAPAFALRKRATRRMSLQEYCDNRAIRPEGVSIIEDAIAHHKNLIVVGGTSSGKTTFVNACIEAISRLTPNDRLLILEDTPELQSSSPNSISLQTSLIANIDMRRLAQISMRMAPRRILVGEVRDFAALEMLKVWSTGHPGGISTFHADSAADAMQRLESLVEEAGLGPKRDLIGRAVDVVVFMSKTPQHTRVVDSIIKINGFNPDNHIYEKETVYAYSA